MKKLSYMALWLIGIIGALSLWVANADSPTVTRNTANVVPDTYTLNWNTGFTAWTITVTDWTTTITILDRNLWATAAWTWCEDINYDLFHPKCSEIDNTYWYLFQWWNNYWFPSHWELSNMSSTLVSSPINIPYSSSTFITGHSNWMNDDSVVNLWWWTTNDGSYNANNRQITNAQERQWPCPDWFHVPSAWELYKLHSMFDNKADIHEKLLIPFAGYRKWEDWSLVTQGFWIGLMSSSINPNQTINYNLLVVTINNWVQSYMHHNSRSTAQLVRCFYNQYTEYWATLPTQISSISITWITLPVGWNIPTKEWIVSATTWITVSNGNTIWNMNYDMVRCSVDTNPELCDVDLPSFVAWTKYNLYIPFTVDDWYVLANSFTATDGTNNAIETDWDIKRVIFQYTAIAPASTPTTYTITWKNWNDTLKEDTVNAWETPSYTWDTPIKAEDSACTYTFDKWTPDIVAANDNATYTATFTCTAKQSSSSSSSSSSWGGWGGKTVKKDTTNTETDKTTEKENTDKDVPSATENNSDTPTNPSEVLDNWFTREQNDAYKFAFENWITTMENIDKANMDDPLIRIAMAKMLSQYAINILKKTPDTTKTCKFSDVSEQLDADYNNWVTLACQLGIMGVWIEKFRPNDEVTRAEFGTALSRMLYGTADWDWAYYKPHLEVLKKLWIISNDNPELKELRGYVMIMLMRSAN